LNESKGEAIYTDIDPDIQIDSHGENIVIDMDNDGVMDFSFFQRSYSFIVTTYYSGYATSHLNGIFVGSEVIGNKIAGSIVDTETWPYRFHAYAFPENATIDEPVNFYAEGFQTMAMRYRGLNSSYFGFGAWYPEVLDHYLGVYFKDSLDCYHYGWIRCDVKDGGRTLIVKDYAYETKCDVGILAGDKLGDTTTVDIAQINTLDAIIYSFGNNIYVSLNLPEKKTEIHIFDLAGRLIYSEILSNKFSTIHLHQPVGAYIAELISEGKKYSKRVDIHQ
jgi:hypothetical protein